MEMGVTEHFLAGNTTFKLTQTYLWALLVDLKHIQVGTEELFLLF